MEDIIMKWISEIIQEEKDNGEDKNGIKTNIN